MAASFYIKQNDTAPSLQAVLTDSNGRVKSMADASLVRFHMRDEQNNALVTNGIGTIVNGTKGIVAYEWQTGDTANTGIHSAEFQITYNSGKIETFPNTGYIKVVIKDEIA